MTLSPVCPPLNISGQMQGRQLTLSGNEITDAVRQGGLSGDGLLNDGSMGFWPGATNLRTNNGFETNTTGWTGLLSSTLARVAPITDTFTRANGAIGNAETGETWVQVAAAGTTVLATIASNRLVTAASGGALTAAYSGIDLGANRKTTRMSARISFGAGTSGGAAVLISNPNGLGTIANITDGAVHIVFTDTKCDIAYFASSVYTIVTTYTYPAPLVRDGVTEYAVGWSICGTTLRVEMPDGTTQTSTNANYATYRGRYSTFQHYYSSGQCAPIFSDVAIDSGVAKFGTGCLQVTTPGAATDEGVDAVGISVTVSSPYTEGIWVNAPSGATLRLQLAERLVADAADITATNTDFVGTGDWQSVAVSKTLGGTSVVEHVRVLTVTSNQAITFMVDGSQLETTLVRTPYTPSSRLISRAQIPVAGRISAAQGWVAMRVRFGLALTASTQVERFWTWGDSGTDRLSLFGQNTPQIGFVRNGGGTGTATNISLTPAVDDYATLIAKWTPSLHGLSVNGSVFTTTATTAVPALAAATMSIGTYFDGTLSGTISALWFACGLGTLSDTDALLIHGVGNADPSPGRFSATARLTTLADFRTGTYSSVV